MTAKHCPFCGYVKSRTEEYDGNVWRVCCRCMASSPPRNSAAAALEAWNDRRYWKDRKAAKAGGGE